MVKILLGFAFFLWSGFGVFAGFNPYGFSQPYYNPGPGYLRPSYSYQQPYGYNSGPGYSYMFQKPRSNNGKPSAFACTRFSCGTLKGFKACLMDPSSPLRYFASRPYAFRDIRSIKMLRKFISTHPNCYSQFCNRVCSTVPVQFQKPKPLFSQTKGEEINSDDEAFENEEGTDEDIKSRDGDESVLTDESNKNKEQSLTSYKKPNWFARQRNRFKKNQAWRIHESHKRNVRYNRVEKLCQSKSMAGNEIKILCSECMPYLKDDREMIPACEVSLIYNGRIQSGIEELKLMDVAVATPVVGKNLNDQGKQKIDQAREEQQQKKRGENSSVSGEEEEMSDTSSQSSGSSEGSQESKTSDYSQNSGLTKEIVAQVPMGGPLSIQKWAQNVSKQ